MRFSEHPAVIIPVNKLAAAAALPYIRARGGADNFTPLYANAAGTGVIRGYLLDIPMTPGLRDQLRSLMVARTIVASVADFDESGSTEGRTVRFLIRKAMYRKPISTGIL